MALLIKQGSQNLINSTLESVKRAMKSTVSTIISGLIVGGIVLFSVIQLFKQFEIYILQNYENGESLLTMIYGVVAIVGLISLFLIFSKPRWKTAKIPEVKFKHEPVEAAISGFMSGFYSGLKKHERQEIINKPTRVINRGA